MITKKKLIASYGEWLRGWTWDFFGTLTFAGYPSRIVAELAFASWIAEVEAKAGASDFRYVKVLERGAFKDNLHFHIVVGGLQPKFRNFPFPFQMRWKELAGHASLAIYDPTKNGIEYMLKTLFPDAEFDIALVFREPVQPRKKETR